jgi:3-oxoadipate enol-lactonase
MNARGRTPVPGCDDAGAGRVALVLVHGFPHDRTVWSAQLRDLSDLARVIVPDLRGFGEVAHRGDDRPPATSMDHHADDLARILDALEVEDAVIGGVSMGGYVAMAFHRLHPKRVRGLVLVDTRGTADSAEERRGRDEAASLVRTAGVPALAAKMIGKMLVPSASPAAVARRDALLRLMESAPAAGVLAALEAIRDRPDSMATLAAAVVPTLVVCGAEDALIPPRHSEALCYAVPGARLVLIPGAAHLPNYEQPEAFQRAVRDFLPSVR